MKKLINFLKSKTTLASLLVIAIIGVAGVGVAQFGPDRPTKQYKQGIPGFNHVTFNSFTGVPNIGDERNFHTGKIAGAPDGFYDPMNQVRDGNEILMRVYVHNGADSSLNSKKNNHKGIARNTKVRVEVPEGNLAKAHQTKAYISADNAKPAQVHDTVDVNAAYPFEFDYVEGSAEITSNFMDGKPLSDNIVKDGVLIGDQALNGNVRGCFEFVALVTYKVKVKAPNYDIEKSVRLDGEDISKWREHAEAKPGDRVEWRLEFKNSGKTKLSGVDMFDDLPDHMSIVPGTTEIYNSNNPNGVNAGTDAVVKNGIDVGHYNPGSNAIVIFDAKIADEEELECGTTTMVNDGYAQPDGHGAVVDKASVTVKKDCVPEPGEPKFSCDLLKVDIDKNRKANFTVNATAENGAEIKQYRYDFGDGTEELVTDQASVSHTYAEPGQYAITAKVDVEVDGEIKTAESEDCTAVIDFPKKPEVPPTVVTADKPVTPGQLPETGPGDVLAVFLAVVAASSAAYFVVVRRLSSIV
jgi:uncharacterized repeat protein (TIGR01451 family)